MQTLSFGIQRTTAARNRLPFILGCLSGRRLNTAGLARLLGVSRPTAVAYLRSLEQIGVVTLIPFWGGRRRPLLVAWEDSSPYASLVRELRVACPDCRLYWWERRTRRVHLVVDLGNERVGFSLSPAKRLKSRDWMPIALALQRKVIDRGFVLHAGDRVVRNFKPWIFGLPLGVFFQYSKEWIFTWRDPRESWDAMYRINRAACARPGFA